MTSASLNKMSVPAADNTIASQGLLMPKLQYRFRVTFQNFGTSPTGPITQQVMEFARPNVTFENIDLPVYNSTVKIAGKHAWQDITFKIRDDAQSTASRLVGEQLQKQLDFAEQSSAAAGINYKFQATFEVLDGGNGNKAPIQLEIWNLYGAYLQGVNYDAANYGSNEVMTITMTIRYDNAEQAVNGVGSISTASVPGQGAQGQPVSTG